MKEKINRLSSERIMKELAIELIYARTLQAKRRIERANKKLQNLLFKQLRLDSILSLEDANTFVQKGPLCKTIMKNML